MIYTSTYFSALRAKMHFTVFYAALMYQAYPMN